METLQQKKYPIENTASLLYIYFISQVENNFNNFNKQLFGITRNDQYTCYKPQQITFRMLKNRD